MRSNFIICDTIFAQVVIAPKIVLGQHSFRAQAGDEVAITVVTITPGQKTQVVPIKYLLFL